MQKRSFAAVLRFNKAKRDNDPLKFMLNELMLYRPTRGEIDMDQVESMYNETYDGKSKIARLKEQVMEHLEGVEEACYYVEQVPEKTNRNRGCVLCTVRKNVPIRRSNKGRR